MSRHLDRPAPRRAAAGPGNKHRAEVRPRYGRIAALTASVVITGVALLGSVGLLPSGADPETASAAISAVDGNIGSSASQTESPERSQTEAAPDNSTAPAPEGAEAATAAREADLALPARSGQGRRIVFSQSRQRVWLVGDQRVKRTYLASGSTEDNLDPGTYDVYSRSEDAIGIDDSGTMKFFVRFTQGDTGAAIGFHDIPIKDGDLVQTKAQLGTPLSHGCIRQKRQDAIMLWDFAPIGTKVVVTA